LNEVNEPIVSKGQVPTNEQNMIDNEVEEIHPIDEGK